MDATSRCWVSQLTAAMNGELSSGIGSQIQSWSLNAVTAGAGMAVDSWSNEQGKKRMRELTLQGRLTSDEREELATLRGAEYARLDRSYREDPGSLSSEDRMKHRRSASAYRAARVTEYRAQQQSKVDAIRADERAVHDRVHREAELARKHRDPEPLLTTGTRPATASSKLPAGVDSMGALHRKSLHAVEKAAPFLNAAGLAERCRKEWAQKMSGKEFKTFDEFRSEFWKTMAESSYAGEFAGQSFFKMSKGLAPASNPTQWLGERKAYELHHIIPIHEGGVVYDFSNILITTPKYHIEILPKAKHFGVKK